MARNVSQATLDRATIMGALPPYIPPGLSPDAIYDERFMAWRDGDLLTFVKYADSPSALFRPGTEIDTPFGMGEIVAVDEFSLTVRIPPGSYCRVCDD